MRGVVTETPGHSAAARLDDLNLDLRNQAKRDLHGIERAERLFVTMAVQENMAVRQRPQRQVESPSSGFTREKFRQRHRAGGKLACAIPKAESQELVAQ